LDSLENFYKPAEAKVDRKAENSKCYDPEIHSPSIDMSNFNTFILMDLGNFNGFGFCV
jgi:hypothetical protein